MAGHRLVHTPDPPGAANGRGPGLLAAHPAGTFADRRCQPGAEEPAQQERLAVHAAGLCREMAPSKAGRLRHQAPRCGTSSQRHDVPRQFRTRCHRPHHSLLRDDDPNLDATLLYRYEGRVYCRPDYAAALALKQADDLQRTTLLDTTTQPYWPRWLQEFSQLDDSQIATIPCIHFDQGLIAIEAAKQGQGVVMASPFLVEEELATGVLIEPFEHCLLLPTGYYIVHHRKLAIRPAALALKDWLIEQARAAPR